MAKVLWLDLETTGLWPKTNGIIQIGAKMEVDNKIVDSFVSYVKPLPNDVIEDGALKVNGQTREGIAQFPEASEVLKAFKTFIDQYCDKYDAEDKLIIGGYNTQFDTGFLREWFKKQGDRYYGSYFFWLDIDVMRHLVMYYTATNQKFSKLKGYMKLEAAAKRHGVFIDDAHDAEADITMTRELYHKVNATFMKDYMYASDK